MKRKINKYMLQIALLAIAATFLVITAVFYGLFQKQIQADLAISAKLLQASGFFENPDIDVDSIAISDSIEELRATWIAADGTVLYDNGNDVSKLENHGDRPEVIEALKNGSGQAIRHSDTMDTSTFYYALALENGTVLRVSTEANNIWAVYLSALPTLLLVIVVLTYVTITISHMLTRQLISPIEEMAQHMEDTGVSTPYKELEPFANMIRKQHVDILAAARVRQDFTANVSHELKTPLTAITGYAELIKNDMVDAAGQKHFIDEIIKSANRLLSLINDIIRLSDLDRAEKESGTEQVDMYSLVLDCMNSLKINAMKRGVNLYFEGDHCNIRGDRQMLRELTENLVQNAIRYNNEDGNVWVTIKDEEGPVLRVKDDGIGIPDEDQERVFERFYRVDKSRSKETGGTGLGLAIVKHIVEIHGAKLELHSTLGEGTEFIIRF